MYTSGNLFLGILVDIKGYPLVIKRGSNCDFEAATSSRICFPQQEGSSAGASYLSAELVYAQPHFALSSKETLRHICVYQNGW